MRILPVSANRPTPFRGALLALALAAGCQPNENPTGTTASGTAGTTGTGTSTSIGTSSGTVSGTTTASSTTSGSGTSSGALATTASSSGTSLGTSSSSTSGDACTPGTKYTDLKTCTSNGQCTCPEVCVADRNAGGATLCEIPCGSQADCTDRDAPGVACQPSDAGIDGGGFCEQSYCVRGPAGPVAGSFGAACDVADAGDGTCQPFEVQGFGNPDAGPVFGLCLLNGALDAGDASCTNALAGAGEQCSAGLVCAAQFASYGCLPACTSVGASCDAPGGTLCLALFPGVTTIGVCGQCQADYTPCVTDSDCCDGLSCKGTCQ